MKPTDVGISIVRSRMVILIFVLGIAQAIHLKKDDGTYAMYPKWHACINASISFQFRTTENDGLLMYTDDNGKYDFFEVMLKDGVVRLRLNIVDGRDGSVEITLGDRLGDNRWHRVEIRRNRMETTLTVDGNSDSRVSFGSDFHFGRLKSNNYVYFGGLPRSYHVEGLNRLALPSAIFETRFVGEIRNVIYGNCTCMPLRAEMIKGHSVQKRPKEACEVRNPCGDCLCISTDDTAGCQCTNLQCATETLTHYHLPMDLLLGRTLVNPSGLDATVYGQPAPKTVRGPLGKALEIDGRIQYLHVSGPGHKFECFGDLDLCPMGYTLGLWVKFTDPGRNKGVYLSNGGHRSDSHGIAMLYRLGVLEFVFKKKDGSEWKVHTEDVLPDRWYHVTVAWQQREGLSLFINGDLEDQEQLASQRGRARSDVQHNDFVVGRANDNSGIHVLGTVTVDEFKFWSHYKNDKEIRENGPIYKYILPMDQIRRKQVVAPRLDATIFGNPRLVPGKFGQALKFGGSGDYVDLGLFDESCLGNTTKCLYGLTVSMWIAFSRLDDHTFYLASGQNGLSLYSYGRRLYVDVRSGNRKWQGNYHGLQTGTWYFIEVSWSEERGLTLLVDQQLVDFQRQHTDDTVDGSDNHFYIGKANTALATARTAAATVDEIEMYYGERDTLLFLDFIQRGRPRKWFFAMDSMERGKVLHPSILIDTSGGPVLSQGKIGNGVKLNGKSQFVDFGEHPDNCLGNLDYCIHGAMVGFWIKPSDLSGDNMQFLSSGQNGITLTYNGGRLRASASTSSGKWDVSTEFFHPDIWYFVEISWDPDKGIQLFANNQLVAESTNRNRLDERPDSQLAQDKFYLGRGNINMNTASYGAGVFDEMEYWYGPRDYLVAFGYIQRGKPTGFIIDMEEIEESRLLHPSLPLRVYGHPSLISGKIGNALHLNGDSQYLDIGDHSESCLGNLDLCEHGITISAWMKFNQFFSNMYILSTGKDGIRMYYRDGYIYVTVNNRGKTWRVSVPRFEPGRWYYVELSWHPEFGLNFYVDNQLMAHSPFRNLVEAPGSTSRSFFVGRANPGDTGSERFRYSDMAVDEMEIWYGRREDLLAFDYILRDNIGHETFSMESSANGVVDHPRFTVNLENGATIVPGKVGNAASMNGDRQYVDLGDHLERCLGNLEMCTHGLTVSLWLKAQDLRDDTYFLSSPTYTLFYKDRQLRAKFHANGKTWEASTPNFRPNQWHNVAMSWNPKKGLSLYLDENKEAESNGYQEIQSDQPSSGNVYLGRAFDSKRLTADALVDEVEYWYAPIEQLIANGDFGGIVLHEEIPLNRLDDNDRIVLPSRIIRAHGGAEVVNGPRGGAIRLNGREQFLDFGENFTCGGNPERCHHGFTMLVSLKPETLLDNMYFYDSSPVSLYYQDDRLYATVRTPTKTWTVSSPGLVTQKWQNVEISWHQEVGLTMHLDGKEAAHRRHGTQQDHSLDWNRREFFGRSNTNMQRDRYADATVDKVEVWNARRDYLDSNNLRYGAVAPGGHVSDPSSNGPDTNRQPSVGHRLAGTSKAIRVYGDSFLHFNFDRLPTETFATTDSEDLSFRFITRENDGLIWLYKKDDHLMHLSMRNGNLLFVSRDSSGQQQQFNIRPRSSGTLTDWNWHHFRMSRDGRRVRFVLDGQDGGVYQLRREVQFVAPGDVYLGGTPDTPDLSSSIVGKGFNGAITEIEYRKTLPSNQVVLVSLLNDLSTTTTDNVVIIDAGDVKNETVATTTTTQAPDVTTLPPVLNEEITFTAFESFMPLDPLDLRTGGTISFDFRTKEPNGLLLYNRGRRSRTDFLAVEVYDGKLYLVYDLGSFTRRLAFSEGRVDDSEWHEVRLDFKDNLIIQNLDDRVHKLNIDGRERSHLVFADRLYLGGVRQYDDLPWYVWSRNGFRGCMRNIRLHNVGIPLDSIVRNKLYGIRRGCPSSSRHCRTQPCTSGFCYDRSDGYVCDCSSTHFIGQTCHKDALIAGLNGNNYAIYEFPKRLKTHTNDISLRFQTPVSDALLFQTVDDKSDGYIRAELDKGRAKVTISVDGKDKTYYTGKNLNDYNWHTLYIKRRANSVDMWVDDKDHETGTLSEEDFYLYIKNIHVGSVAQIDSSSDIPNYIGYLQNFRVENRNLIEHWGTLSPEEINMLLFHADPGNLPPLTYYPVTVKSRNTYVRLPRLRIGQSGMHLRLKLKTLETSGIILFNHGTNNEFVAVELSNGKLRYVFDVGGGPHAMVVPTPYMLNDNKWHTVDIKQMKNRQFQVRVDNTSISQTMHGGDNRFNLTGPLFVAGVPADMLQWSVIKQSLHSKAGFQGCLASLDLNGVVADLTKFSRNNEYIQQKCVDIARHCINPDDCLHGGICIPDGTSFYCDCNMTAWAGRRCSEEPIGFRYGKNQGTGAIVYTFPYEKQADSDEDQIALGFMTWYENGTLMRINSIVPQEFVEIRLENGHVVAEYNTDGTVRKLIEKAQKYNDGKYHVARFIRTNKNSTLAVDSYPIIIHLNEAPKSVLNDVRNVVVGGSAEGSGNQFNGIVGGHYWNGWRVLDLGYNRHPLIDWKGTDVIVADHPFNVEKPLVATAPPVDLPAIPPIIPSDIGGGGIAIAPVASGTGDTVVVGGRAGSGTGSGGMIPLGGGGGPMVSGLIAGAPAGTGGVAIGARAGAVVGSVLGAMVAISAIVWAFYLCKPGSCVGGASAGSATPVSISAPGAGLASTGGAGIGGGAKVAVANGSAAGGGGGTAFTANYISADGGMPIDDATLRATGTFTNKGTSLGTSGGGRAYIGSTASAASYSKNSVFGSPTSPTANVAIPRSGSVAAGAGNRGASVSSYHYEGSGINNDGGPDYDLIQGMSAPVPTYHSHTLSAYPYGSMSRGYSTSTMGSAYNYQVQNLRTVTMNRNGRQMNSQGGTMTSQGGTMTSVTPGAAGDEVRVDCCLMAADGRSVTTGSCLCPPQVWDMKTGELMRIMKGDTIGSTNLHLTCNDRLLVGAVHADVEINEYSGRKGVMNRRLQIWDFMTGKALDMPELQYLSALCVMSDKDKVVFARSDTFGNATSVFVWDLLGNQAVKEMRYDAPIGNNDYVHFLALSKNDRYCVAGFTNTFDNFAEFVIFDLTLTSYNILEPSILKLDANPECTVILPNEEAVTGLKNGDLVIWSLRTGQPSRQLLSGSGVHAHSREVKAVTLSENGRYLVSASADGTLKVWDMQSERHLNTLSGHNDEVWCVNVSPDNEVVVSGSRDGTIRLWRLRRGAEICAYPTGVDIFFVTMSHDKGTIVALGDKFGSRKLIMLQVVRTRTRRLLSA